MRPHGAPQRSATRSGSSSHGHRVLDADRGVTPSTYPPPWRVLQRLLAIRAVLRKLSCCRPPSDLPHVTGRRHGRSHLPSIDVRSPRHHVDRNIPPPLNAPTTPARRARQVIAIPSYGQPLTFP